MEVFKINPNHPDPSVIERVRNVLRAGGVIVYPTDTCYGLGCDARNKRAKRRIGQMKRRGEEKRFSVIVRDLDQAADITQLTDDQKLMLNQYLPGPFTFILINTDLRIASASTLGVRIPDYPVTQAIAQVFTEPFITTSANISGVSEPYSRYALNEGVLRSSATEHPDVVIDAGELPKNQPSTVVDLTSKPPHVIREGARPFIWPLRAE